MCILAYELTTGRGLDGLYMPSARPAEEGYDYHFESSSFLPEDPGALDHFVCYCESPSGR